MSYPLSKDNLRCKGIGCPPNIKLDCERFLQLDQNAGPNARKADTLNSQKLPSCFYQIKVVKVHSK